MSSIGPSDNYRSAQGVALPEKLPAELPNQYRTSVDLDGDGLVRGRQENNLASSYLSYYVPDLFSPLLSREMASYIQHLIFVNEEKQEITVYGTTIKIEGEDKVTAPQLWQIAHGLHAFPAGRIREIFGGNAPPRIVVAEQARWFLRNNDILEATNSFFEFNVIGPIRSLLGATNVVAGLFCGKDNTIFLDPNYLTPEIVIHEFAHRVLMQGDNNASTETGEWEYATENSNIFDEALQPGLHCLDSLTADHEQPYCNAQEAGAYVLTSFFYHEEKSLKLEGPLGTYFDTTIRPFVDQGMIDYDFIRANPLVIED
ncbi:MAG: hypothetical protein HQM16_07360 [Deltaproteobacteria bacterium]|nr:hypothetical protein [Deltaproteobacteria bacterium]